MRQACYYVYLIYGPYTYSALGKGAEHSDKCVCLSVCKHISKTTHPNFTKCSVHVSCGRGFVLLRWRCNMLCTSGFVDDVMFSNHELNGSVSLPQQRHCSVVHGLTPLLCGIGSVLDDGRHQDLTSFVQRVLGRSVRYIIALFVIQLSAKTTFILPTSDNH